MASSEVPGPLLSTLGVSVQLVPDARHVLGEHRHAAQAHRLRSYHLLQAVKQ